MLEKYSIYNRRNQAMQADLAAIGKLDELKDLHDRPDGCKCVGSE